MTGTDRFGGHIPRSRIAALLGPRRRWPGALCGSDPAQTPAGDEGCQRCLSIAAAIGGTPQAIQIGTAVMAGVAVSLAAVAAVLDKTLVAILYLLIALALVPTITARYRRSAPVSRRFLTAYGTSCALLCAGLAAALLVPTTALAPLLLAGGAAAWLASSRFFYDIPTTRSTD